MEEAALGMLEAVGDFCPFTPKFMPVGFGLMGGNEPWLCVPQTPGRMLHHRDSSLCFPHFSFYSHLMARGQDQLPWETPAPSSSFC